MSQPYRSLEARLHDSFWDADDDASEVLLMDGFLRAHPGRALEIGAGSGRLLAPLLQLGHEIEGLELSTDMLDLARERARSEAVDLTMHEGDMTSWQTGRTYASLLAPAFTLQLADDPAVALRHWRDWLVPGGAFYLTVFVPLAELEGEVPENEWYQDHTATLPDGRDAMVETRFRIDRTRRILHREHRYTLSGHPAETHESHQTLRWIDPPDLPALLARCGYRLVRWFPDFDPSDTAWDPHDRDFDGIVTCHALRTENAGRNSLDLQASGGKLPPAT